MKKFGLTFGIMAEDVEKQIEAQGFKKDEGTSPEFWSAIQKNFRALIGLKVTQVITDSEYPKICLRFVKFVEKHISLK